MIIFDLDGTLADCEHRRHFVDPKRNLTRNGDHTGSWSNDWKPDWKAFYEACHLDKPIVQVIKIIRELHGYDYYDTMEDVHIWSGRCESVREKTEKWLEHYGITYNSLKMRPIGDSTPDDQLKESWLDEALAQGKTIDFVFDDRPKVIRMWRRRGIFVFNCCQHDEEF